MKKLIPLFACAALVAHLPLSAQEAKPSPAPGEIVAAAKAEEWVAIAPSDLLVMDLAPDAKAKPRRVVIQLMPAPFSQGWIGNIRKLAAAHWWDGTSINRVQDNYVTQWGDATEKKALPDGLAVVTESEYVVPARVIGETLATEISIEAQPPYNNQTLGDALDKLPLLRGVFGNRSEEVINRKRNTEIAIQNSRTTTAPQGWHQRDSVAEWVEFFRGWPLAAAGPDDATFFWSVHCYGMVGVGRNLSPDTGTGAELYTVIGHAPRHLDRNIALVGRVIEGMEHLSSLPRGTGALGFYEKEEERVPILSVRLGNKAKDVGAFEYLSTESESFAQYADARANRRDPFFIKPAGGADICNIPVPVRRKAK